MNRKIGGAASLLNGLCVLGFAFSMLLGTNTGCYLFSMFIAFSFVGMMGGCACLCEKEERLAGYLSLTFAGMYAAIILLVYFAQVTTVRFGGLSQQAAALLDYQQFGLFFSYDLLGYALMALSTFFAGLTIRVHTKADRWLKRLLLLHGIFFFSCLILPMFPVFTPEGEAWVGVAVMEFWCLYFLPVGLLCAHHFLKGALKKGQRENTPNP